MKRAEDTETKFHFRSERLFCSNGDWFFAAREGDLGPYASKFEAQTHLKWFLGEKNELKSFQASRAKVKQLNGQAKVTSLADHLGRNKSLNNLPLDPPEILTPISHSL